MLLFGEEGLRSNQEEQPFKITGGGTQSIGIRATGQGKGTWKRVLPHYQ